MSLPFTLDAQTVELLALAGTVLGAVGLLFALTSQLRFRRLRRDYAVLQGGDDKQSFVAAVRRQLAEVERLRAEVNAAGEDLVAARTALAGAIRHVSVVRFDAFPDMGGRLSFSTALLDDAGDGLVITAINGRSETRSYAKGVKGGGSEHQLSPEEIQAIKLALRGAPAGRRARAAAPERAGQNDRDGDRDRDRDRGYDNRGDESEGVTIRL